jgi:hypothetical protein
MLKLNQIRCDSGEVQSNRPWQSSNSIKGNMVELKSNQMTHESSNSIK